MQFSDASQAHDWKLEMASQDFLRISQPYQTETLIQENPSQDWLGNDEKAFETPRLSIPTPTTKKRFGAPKSVAKTNSLTPLQRKEVKTSLDRPSHWESVKKPKLTPKPTGRSVPLQMFTPNPLKYTTPVTKETSSVDFKPQWLSSQNPNLEHHPSRSKAAEEEIIDYGDTASDTLRTADFVDHSRFESQSNYVSPQVKGKSRISAPKMGSYRWQLAKLLREEELLKNWISNLSNHHTSNRMDPHDPRNRAQIILDVSSTQYLGFFDPFDVALVQVNRMEGKLGKHLESHHADESFYNAILFGKRNEMAFLQNLQDKIRLYDPFCMDYQQLRSSSPNPLYDIEPLIKPDVEIKEVIIAPSTWEIMKKA